MGEYTKAGKSIQILAFEQSNRKAASSPSILIERHTIKELCELNYFAYDDFFNYNTLCFNF